MRAIYFLAFSSLFFAGSFSYGASVYVDGSRKITFRTGPGTDHKVIRMLDTDVKLNLLSEEGEWSKVEASEGVVGYVLNQFLSKAVPASASLEWLRSKYNSLKTENKELEKKLSLFQEQNNDLGAQILTLQKQLNQTEGDYQQLRDGSQKYLSLKTSFDKNKTKLKTIQREQIILESKLNEHYMIWFALGAGVLLLGLLIGKFGRRKYMYDSKITL